MITTWKILDISVEGEAITHAKYHVLATDDTNTVETEGNWEFDKYSVKTPYAEVTENQVISWIKEGATQYGQNVIESRLEEQLALLGKTKSVVPPWKPPVFTLEQQWHSQST
jgi:hypothetical protein